MDFELSEKFQQIDFEIEQALQDVGYHRRRFSEGNIQPFSTKDYSTKNSLQPDCDDIWEENNRLSGEKYGLKNSPRNYSKERFCNTSAPVSPTNGNNTAKAVEYTKPVCSRKMITDSISVLITNSATKKCALISGGQSHSMSQSTPVCLQGGQKRPRSPMVTETNKLSRAKPILSQNNHSSENHDTKLSTTEESLVKSASPPRSSNALFVKLSRPKSPAQKLRILTTETSKNDGDRQTTESRQKVLSPRQAKPMSHFVTSNKTRPSSSSNASTSITSTTVALRRPRSSLQSPRLIQRPHTAHKYEPKRTQKGTNESESSPGRSCYSTVNGKYRATSPKRYAIHDHKQVCTSVEASQWADSPCNVKQHPWSSSGSPLRNRRQSCVPDISHCTNHSSEEDNEDLENQDLARPIPTIVVTDWDTSASQAITDFDTGSNAVNDHVFNDPGNVRRRHSDPGTVDRFKESDAHYQAMVLERRRISFGNRLQLSSQVGLDIDNLVCR